MNMTRLIFAIIFQPDNGHQTFDVSVYITEPCQTGVIAHECQMGFIAHACQIGGIAHACQIRDIARTLRT